MKVSNCFEVHVRNSLLRVGAHPLDKQEKVKGKFKGAALRVMADAMVLVEGSTLMSPGMDSDRVLHVDKPTAKFSGCLFAHSSTDSVRLNGWMKGGNRKQWVDVKQGPP